MVQISRRQLLAAAGAVTVVSIAGCDSGDGADTDVNDKKAGSMDGFKVGDQFKATEPLKFSAMMLSNQNYPFNANWPMLVELAKRTNVSFEATAVPGSDYNQKVSVVVSAGQAPQIIPKTYHPAEEAFIAGGAILPVSDYVHLMPHFTDKVQRWKLEGNLAQMSQQDGKYYLLPGLHEAVWQDYSIGVRTDILEKHSLAVPTTWDELTTTLRALKTAYPGQYPFSDRWSSQKPGPGANNLIGLLATSYGTRGGWNYDTAYWDGGKFVLTGAMDQYRQVVQYLATLVSEKLLDPESFTQTDDQARQKFASGKSFVISVNAQTVVNEARKDIAKIPGAKVAKIPLPTGPMGATLSGESRLENGIMLSKKALESKNFVAMLQFIDWLWYSDAGLMFSKWGIEGDTYTGKVEDGSFKLNPQIKWAGLNPDAPKNLQVDYGFFNGVFAYGGSTQMLNSQFTDEEKAFQAEMNKRTTREVGPPHPFSPEEREQAGLWEAAIADYVNQQTLAFILGKRPLSEWDKYVAELNAKGGDKYIELANKAYDRFKGKK
ncbi:ABC transporter substrate-binding protein [Paractinoplanes durhamensis]|uniref:Sugar ABC transporter substrate-binding protein n=1 Tax=Paractinoplanes durhamensis TaxID=113563 RepID=A0ABQ3ZDX9_9ACTN|nr:extracellular solute-binding protein [Actinoplanes durhamensis]GIE08048.1 sugar ABC transporter substrate-binding protein [Actinoplanes durhamensis]